QSVLQDGAPRRQLRTMQRSVCGTALLVCSLCLTACGGSGGDTNASAATTLPPTMQPTSSTNADARPPAIPFDSATPRTAPRVVRSFPHDTGAYTQGLLIYRGRLLESTGRLGLSDGRD